MTYPTVDPEEYSEWTSPKHECEFIDDNTVQAGKLEEGQMVVYKITRCTQCENTRSIRTDKTVKQPRLRK